MHLPWLHEQTHDKPADTPGVSVQVLISAAERMIEAIIRSRVQRHGQRRAALTTVSGAAPSQLVRLIEAQSRE